jgi:hypothetical protein
MGAGDCQLRDYSLMSRSGELICFFVQRVKVQVRPPPKKKPVGRLTPVQLRRLADRMVASNDPSEVARLKEQLERGFYGDSAHA